MTPTKFFKVGQREQSIPEFAMEQGNRWYYLRMFSVKRYKLRPEVITVWRSIVYQNFDEHGNWINQFTYSDDQETWNKNRSHGTGGNHLRFDSLDEALAYADKRITELQSLWPVLEDVKAIHAFPLLLS